MTTLTLPAPDAAPPYHWTPTSQRQFLEHLAETGSITRAAAAVAMSPRSAHNLRHRRDGAAFRIGWDAALLIARAALADSLMERAIDGQVETITRDGDTLTRRRHDNRLGMSLLSRLDRIADTDPASGADGPLARLVAQDFEAFLDLVERGGSGSEAALFVAARTPTDPAGIEADERCELGDPEDEEEAPADPEASAAAMSVWEEEDDGGERFRTDYPPPPGFDGEEDGRFGERDYSRTLTDSEHAAAEARAALQRAPLRIAAEAARDVWFGFAPPEPDVLGLDEEWVEDDGEEAEAFGGDADIHGIEAEEGSPALAPARQAEAEAETDSPGKDDGVPIAPVELAPRPVPPKPTPEPEPNPGYRRIAAQPRPRPYANGRPPDYVREFNRGWG